MPVMAATQTLLARIHPVAWRHAVRTQCKDSVMKILTTISIVAVVATMAGAAAAQAVAQADPSQAAPDATAAAPAAAATTAVPDQVQTPTPAATTVAATVTNGPIPDTPANRAKYGAPMSHAGKKTQPAGN